MSFAAKFGGTCSKCAGRIPAGALVNYDGKAIRHAPRCPAAGTVTELPAPEPRKDDTVTDETKILGRATYKGKMGYLILWMGTTKKGEAAKLAFRDGSKVFWADRAEIRIEKEYGSEYRGRIEHMTFGRLNRLAKEFAEEKATEAKAIVDARKVQADRDAAREAKAAATGKTMTEIIAEEDAARADARKGLATFTREGKDSAIVGEKFTSKGKDYEIVSVGKSYYYSAEDEEMDEDMDNFSSIKRHGWYTPFDARNTTTPEQAAQRTAEAEERKTLETAIRGSYGVGPNPAPGSTGWDRPTCHLTDIWSESRAAGSEHWYLGADGVVYHMRSDYDMGPMWWRTTATVEMIERAKVLGMKVIS